MDTTQKQNIENIKAQLRKGTLEYCVLSILARNDAYASSIIEVLKESEMIVVEGTLYTILTRLKNQGVLAYRWEESPQGPPRKYYSLSEEGLALLGDMDIVWGDLVGQINKIRNLQPRLPQ